jgi:hypothetical protein
MYKRDVSVVVLSFLALFLCLQHEGNFSFRKAWCARLNLPNTCQQMQQYHLQLLGLKALGYVTLTVQRDRCRYHVTLQESEGLQVLQDKIESLPPPLVVSCCLLAYMKQQMPSSTAHATFARAG